jgi:predicted site-specific integrase-resolvase
MKNTLAEVENMLPPLATFTLAQAARIVGVSPSLLYRYRDEGKIKILANFGRFRISRAELERLISEMK